jgi:hypothetical protein
MAEFVEVMGLEQLPSGKGTTVTVAGKGITLVEDLAVICMTVVLPAFGGLRRGPLRESRVDFG